MATDKVVIFDNHKTKTSLETDMQFFNGCISSLSTTIDIYGNIALGHFINILNDIAGPSDIEDVSGRFNRELVALLCELHHPVVLGKSLRKQLNFTKVYELYTLTPYLYAACIADYLYGLSASIKEQHDSYDLVEMKELKELLDTTHNNQDDLEILLAALKPEVTFTSGQLRHSLKIYNNFSTTVQTWFNFYAPDTEGPCILDTFYVNLCASGIPELRSLSFKLRVIDESVAVCTHMRKRLQETVNVLFHKQIPNIASDINSEYDVYGKVFADVFTITPTDQPITTELIVVALLYDIINVYHAAILHGNRKACEEIFSGNSLKKIVMFESLLK